jgi:hypothetical protein
MNGPIEHDNCANVTTCDAGASLTYQARQRVETKDYSWTSQSILNFEFHLGIVAPPFTKGIQSKRICNIM